MPRAANAQTLTKAFEQSHKGLMHIAFTRPDWPVWSCLLRTRWGQPTEACLPASAVVGAFDPGDDRNAQLLAGVSAAAVQDVLLQQATSRHPHPGGTWWNTGLGN
jgi:hypothetical protein